jgi:DnaJ domain
MFFGGGDPFEHFAGMGGGGGRGPPRGPINTDEYYNILGVAKDADENAIKKAYRKLALKVNYSKSPGINQLSIPHRLVLHRPCSSMKMRSLVLATGAAVSSVIVCLLHL